MSKKISGKLSRPAVLNDRRNAQRRRTRAAARRQVTLAQAAQAQRDDETKQPPPEPLQPARPVGAAASAALAGADAGRTQTSARPGEMPTNGNGAANAKSLSRDTTDKIFTLQDEHFRLRTRGVIYEMLGDGTLVSGLQKSLASDHDRLAKTADRLGSDDALQEKRKFEDARLGQTNRQTIAAPQPRYAQFLDVIDLDIDKISSMIGGLEDRLSFVTYDGPGEVRETSQAGATNIGPVNRLEQELHDRARRLALVRDRLEQLHTNLRI